MPDRIEMMTIGCSDLAASQDAYCRHLAQQPLARGEVDAQLARLWGMAAMQGAQYTLLAPEGDTRHCIRLVQVGPGLAPQPFTTPGWNAAELLVGDVDALAEDLAGSPFTVVGPPENLSFTDKIRACQVVGPAGEALYLTQVMGAVPGFQLPQTDRVAAHCFVVILGARDLAASRRFYHETFGLAEAPIIQARVSMLSAALGLGGAQLHNLCAAPLAEPGYLIEMDELPVTAAPCDRRAGILPAGIALLSLSCANRPVLQGAAVTLDMPPYNGRRVSFRTGPNGEMLEVIDNS